MPHTSSSLYVLSAASEESGYLQWSTIGRSGFYDAKMLTNRKYKMEKRLGGKAEESWHKERKQRVEDTSSVVFTYDNTILHGCWLRETKRK